MVLTPADFACSNNKYHRTGPAQPVVHLGSKPVFLCVLGTLWQPSFSLLTSGLIIVEKYSGFTFLKGSIYIVLIIVCMCVCVLAAEDKVMASSKGKCENGLWILCRSMQSFPQWLEASTLTFWRGSDSTHPLTPPFSFSHSHPHPGHVTPSTSLPPWPPSQFWGSYTFKFLISYYTTSRNFGGIGTFPRKKTSVIQSH